MIIRFPTGFYRSLLPHGPNIAGNITYTVSMMEPPRSNLLFPKIPTSIVLKQKSPKARIRAGELVYTVAKTNNGGLASNRRTMQIGQVLEFSGSVDAKLPTPMLVSNHTELQHGLAPVDYDALGLDQTQRAAVTAAATAAYERITDELNEARQARDQSEVALSENQKTINALKRALAALEVIDQSTQAVIELKQQLLSATAQQEQLLVKAATTAAASQQLLDDLRKVAALVH